MKRVERTKTIQAPLRRVYDQATQFEQYPRILVGVKSVRHLDDTHLIWQTQLWGRKAKSQADILEQIPDEKIVWECQGHRAHKVTLLFKEVNAHSATVSLVLEHWPKGFWQHLLANCGVISSFATASMNRFARFVEKRPLPTGAWRGEIRNGAVTGPVPGRNVFG